MPLWWATIAVLLALFFSLAGRVQLTCHAVRLSAQLPSQAGRHHINNHSQDSGVVCGQLPTLLEYFYVFYMLPHAAGCRQHTSTLRT
jgi:hypothetical protein